MRGSADRHVRVTFLLSITSYLISKESIKADFPEGFPYTGKVLVNNNTSPPIFYGPVLVGIQCTTPPWLEGLPVPGPCPASYQGVSFRPVLLVFFLLTSGPSVFVVYRGVSDSIKPSSPL